MRRSQTATEYLIILAVVIVIALIVVGVIGGIPGIGGGTSERSNNVKLSSQDIGITSFSSSDTATKVTLRNNLPSAATITQVMINNTVCSPAVGSVALLSGESTTITCTNVVGITGKNYDFLVNITYTDSTSTQYSLNGMKITGKAGTGTNSSGSNATNGACGDADGTNVSSAPSTGLCSAGNASSVTENSGTYSWTCTGTDGGTTDSCSATYTADPIDGVCGDANGQSFTDSPSTDLCSAGTASDVSGSGPWTWTCTGANGGSEDSCSAEITTYQCSNSEDDDGDGQTDYPDDPGCTSETDDSENSDTSTLTDGLIGYWPLDSDTNDYSGNNNDGTNNGATQTDGNVGGAYSFDGDNNKIDTLLDPTTELDQEVTISAWVKPNQATSTKGVAGGYTYPTPQGLLFLQWDTGNGGGWKSGYPDNDGDWGNDCTNVDLELNVWSHVITVYNGENYVKTYVNSQLMDTITKSYPITQYSSFRIGVAFNSWDDGREFNGEIDEIAVWNRALSESEISELYNSGDGLSLIQ